MPIVQRHPPELASGPPDFSAGHLTRAMDEGGTDAAIALCDAQIADAPADAKGYRHLGQIRAARGEFLPALRAAMRACELAPDDPRAWSDLGRVHAFAGETEHAIRCFQEAIEIDVRHADAWHNLGIALKKLGRRELAFNALKNALLIDSTRAESYLTLGNLLVESGQYEDALEAFERAAKNDPSLASARSRLGDQFSQRGKTRRAEVLFRQSLGLDPDHIDGWLGLGRVLEDLGLADGARAAYLNVLRRRPDHAVALGNYLGLAGDAGSDAGEATHWVAVAQGYVQSANVADEPKALIGYGLAKYLDRRREQASAAEAGRMANEARRRATGPLDRNEIAARVDALIHAYDADFFAKHRRSGIGTDQPVFIVGLPRSGTTLTEQILAAHPLMHGAGELPDLARLAFKVAGEREPWEAAASLELDNSRVVAGHYLRALRSDAPKKRLRISDKAPLNFFQLAFAALLFPNARVIHCHRSPRDTALSIWMENFNAEQRYATDFEDLAFFWAQYQRLMAHWHRELPLRILEVQYEETVEDLEKQARRLVDFLEVPWDSHCLDFHKSERAVQTPSRWQVRQPIYRRSLERWRAYAEFLPELVAAFPDRDPGEMR